MINGYQIDADPEAETITYSMADGTEWTDGNQYPVESQKS